MCEGTGFGSDTLWECERMLAPRRCGSTWLYQSSHSGLPESRDDQQVSVGLAVHSPSGMEGSHKLASATPEDRQGCEQTRSARARGRCSSALEGARAGRRSWSGRSSRSPRATPSSIDERARARRADRGRRGGRGRVRGRDLARAARGAVRGHRHAGADPRGGARALRPARTRIRRRRWSSRCPPIVALVLLVLAVRDAGRDERDAASG